MTRLPVVSALFSNVTRFLKLESASGIVLGLAAIAATIVANSAFNPVYQAALSTKLGPLSVSGWINDGLMALFFFVVGMEIKYELIDGALNSFARASLPVFGAIGGMIVPALIFYSLNHSGPYAAGWGIPMATDIAFAIGVITVLGNRVPQALKIFLLALAIADDLGAIIVIALFYSSGVKLAYLGIAAGILALIYFISRRDVRWVPLHVLLGLAVWFFVHEAGVHATIAGCALGFLMPHDDNNPADPTPLNRWVSRLHPVVGFAIMPIFAFANAGVVFSGIPWSEAFTHPLVIGIGLGLAVGKTIGIFGVSMLAVKLGFAKLPEMVNKRALLGTAALGGIGFTMALFIAGLALKTNSAMNLAKVGIIGGSLLSAVIGVALLMSSRGRSA
ncbi:MAG: Na+/H+ antiporter NhaA [Bdellovibrionota bacterium]